MTKLTKDQVKKIARLCRIKLTPEEIDKFTSQLTSILDYVQKINEVDTGKITFKSQTDLVNITREDTPGECLSSDEATGQSELKKGKYFAIPKILETET